jgi:hypothetical protein
LSVSRRRTVWASFPSKTIDNVCIHCVRNIRPVFTKQMGTVTQILTLR